MFNDLFFVLLLIFYKADAKLYANGSLCQSQATFEGWMELMDDAVDSKEVH